MYLGLGLGHDVAKLGRRALQAADLAKCGGRRRAVLPDDRRLGLILALGGKRTGLRRRKSGLYTREANTFVREQAEAKRQFGSGDK